MRKSLEIIEIKEP